MSTFLPDAKLIASFALGFASCAAIFALQRRIRHEKGHDPPSGRPLFSDLPSGSPTLLASDDVKEAPKESMDLRGTLPGSVLKHSDNRGTILKLRVSAPSEEPGIAGDGTIVNSYFTRKGYRRSGDLHAVPQFDLLLTGRAKLTILDPQSGIERTVVLEPNVLVEIPAYHPHVFEFLEDTSMLEWWAGEFKAWYFMPYRRMIST